MISARTAIAVVGVVTALTPWFYEKGQTLAVLIKNRPGQLPSKNSFATYQVLYEDAVRNCEDAAIDEASGFALLSCDPGRDFWNTVMGIFLDSKKQQGDLYIYHYARAVPGAGNLLRKLDRSDFPADRDFHPLGIEYHRPSGRLFVVNHAVPTGIEVFKTSLANERLIYEATFEHPGIHTPNAIHAIANDELFVTNDHFVPAHTNKYASLVETWLGLPGGSVNYVNLGTGEVKLLARVPFANGVTQFNSTHIAVASSSSAHVRVYEWEAVNKTLSLKQTIRTPLMPDNLSVDSAGILLIAGHPYPPLLDDAAKRNHQYALDGEDDGRLPASERPRAPSAVVSWDGNAEGRLQTLYVGSELDAGSTAVRDVKRKTGILTGLYAKGILVWKE